MVYQTDERQEDGLPRRCLDDSRLAHAGGVQVDVRTLLLCFCFDVQIQYLDDVTDKVWQLPESC